MNVQGVRSNVTWMNGKWSEAESGEMVYRFPESFRCTQPWVGSFGDCNEHTYRVGPVSVFSTDAVDNCMKLVEQYATSEERIYYMDVYLYIHFPPSFV